MQKLLLAACAVATLAVAPAARANILLGYEYTFTGADGEAGYLLLQGMNAGGPTNPGVAITYITGGELVITSAGSGCSSGSPCFPIGDYDLDASVGLGDGGNFEDESGDIGDLYFLPTPSVPVPSFTDDELYINEINSSVYLTLQNGQLNNNDRLSVTVPPVAEYATEPADTPEPPPLALLAAGLLALAGAFYFHTRRTKDGIATAA